MEEERKVLIIDENLMDVMAAEKSLRAEGYHVVRLASPAGCVAKIDYERPDILIIDISMARLNAQELFDSIRKNSDHEDLIIVLASDLDAETLQEMCLEHDFHGYFCKSMGSHQLGAFINNFFEEHEEYDDEPEVADDEPEVADDDAFDFSSDRR